MPPTIAIMFLASLSPAQAADPGLIELCRTIVAHEPVDDVRYRPGVDVRGKAVVPADVSGSKPLELPNDIAIDLTVPLRQLIGDAAPALIAEADTALGQVTVNRESGEIRYNGQLLSSPASATLVQSCLRLHLGRQD